MYITRRCGRVVDCGSLENCCTARYRRFESYRLRKVNLEMQFVFHIFTYIKTIIKNQNKNMKKVFFALAIAATAAACSSEATSTEEVTVDSTAVAVDSVTVDSLEVLEDSAYEAK
jgi:hypothetical protein